MEKNDTLRNLLISGGIFLLILWAVPKLLPPPPPPQTAQRGPGDTTQAADAAPTAPDSAEPQRPVATTSGDREPVAKDDSQGFRAVEADAEQTVALGSGPFNGADKKAPPSPYRMRLTVSNVGASIESATLTDHAATLGSDERFSLLTDARRDDGRRFRSLVVEQVSIDNVVIPLHDKRWHLDPIGEYETRKGRGQRARLWIDILEDGAPAMRISRVFDLPRQNKKIGRHDLNSTITIENLSSFEYNVVLTYRGGLGVHRVSERMDDRFIDWGVDDQTRVVGDRKTQAAVCQMAEEPILLFEPTAESPNHRLSWAATANTYFTCTVAPLDRQSDAPASYLAEVTAIDADRDPLTDDDATVRFTTRREMLAPQASLAYPADIYLGEKDGAAFKSIETYKKRNYYYQISQGFGMCTFTWLVELMIWLLDGLFAVTRDFGVAIVILVLVVRTLLHPITKKGQVNMVRMQQSMGQLAPKMEELKRRYANDKAKLQQETMKVYRDQGVNPATQMLTCLPMFIQMPIWVALYLSLSNNILMRHETAFWGLTWIKDMTAPDALYTFSSALHVPFVGWELPSFNLLPLLVAVFMYTQQKLQPKPKPNPNATDQQRQQQEMMQKMMPMMSIMMLLIFYKMPSGLNLYIMASSLFGTIEQYRIRKHIRDHEDAGTLHKPRGAADPKARDEAGGLKKPKLPSFFQKLQKMADEAHKAQPKRPPKKSKSRR